VINFIGVNHLLRNALIAGRS